MNTIKAQFEQSIWDVAIQEYGDVQDVFKVLDSNGLDINSELESGQELYIQKNPDVVNRDVMKEFRSKNTKVVCGTGVMTRGGIGFMKIGYDFIVS